MCAQWGMYSVHQRVWQKSQEQATAIIYIYAYVCNTLCFMWHKASCVGNEATEISKYP